MAPPPRQIPPQREGPEVPPLPQDTAPQQRTSPTSHQEKTRREFLRTAAQFTATAAGLGGGLTLLTRRPGPGRELPTAAIPAATTASTPTPRGPFDTTEPPTSYGDITGYNNFYEFGLTKEAPARHAGQLRTQPWAVVIDGEVNKPQTVDIAALSRWFAPEDRIYRMRCVEAWSMVIPWRGFALERLLRLVEPTSQARYVQFTTLHDPAQMPGQRYPILEWPYTEGLRLDEALHPLTFLALGVDGRDLLPQNGAPLRLVVPWKYGFKGAKSIVRITLTRDQPRTTWALAASDEYGFYANVNPAVDHPRWSQASERRIGEWGRRKTLPFNGYAEQVAHLYSGLDLRENF